ncbi:hypothetical protein D3C87_1735570 [compost metagenome]
MLEGVEQQDGAEDDPQQAQGNQQALQGRGEYAVEAHLPGEQANGGSYQIDQWHGVLGRPAQADQQDGGEQDRRESE